MSFKDELTKKADIISGQIREFLPKEEGFQKIIFEACNYSVINGGKRIRPMLIAESYLLCRGQAGVDCATSGGCAAGPLLIREGWDGLSEDDKSKVLPFMAAIEMIHCSSLVHDDLPCMDNDTLRRGVPSTWAKFGEDMGTLAGDGLMIYAFETACKSTAEPERRLKAIEILAQKTGIYGMIGGQTVDVELTGKTPSKEQLDFIYRLKTGALIEASLMIGAVLAGASQKVLDDLEKAGRYIGLAFQIEDDILDVTSTVEELGKPIGSDEANGKITWLTYYGMESSVSDVKRFTSEALAIIESIGGNPFLTALIKYLAGRKS